MGARVARGENIRCCVEVRDFFKALANASAIDLIITDPDGNIVESKTLVDVTHAGLGLYFYSYKPTIDAVTGTYTVFWDVTYSAEHRKSRAYIIVTE